MTSIWASRTGRAVGVWVVVWVSAGGSVRCIASSLPYRRGDASGHPRTGFGPRTAALTSVTGSPSVTAHMDGNGYRRAALLTAVLVALAGLAIATGVPAGAATAATWTGTFDGFPGAAWAAAWGQSPEKAWGLGGDLTAVGDPTSPRGAVLDARYGTHSSAHSCTSCPATGGGEFYTRFTGMGHPEWATAAALDLKYFVRFPSGFDFGKGGKLPGLYGGKIGEESGGVHGHGFSTRY